LIGWKNDIDKPGRVSGWEFQIDHGLIDLVLPHRKNIDVVQEIAARIEIVNFENSFTVYRHRSIRIELIELEKIDIYSSGTENELPLISAKKFIKQVTLLNGVLSFKKDAFPALELLLEFFNLFWFRIVEEDEILRNYTVKNGSNAKSAFDDHLIVF